VGNKWETSGKQVGNKWEKHMARTRGPAPSGPRTELLVTTAVAKQKLEERLALVDEILRALLNSEYEHFRRHS
jgi:hypothetical protein